MTAQANLQSQQPSTDHEWKWHRTALPNDYRFKIGKLKVNAAGFWRSRIVDTRHKDSIRVSSHIGANGKQSKDDAETFFAQYCENIIAKENGCPRMTLAEAKAEWLDRLAEESKAGHRSESSVINSRKGMAIVEESFIGGRLAVTSNGT